MAFNRNIAGLAKAPAAEGSSPAVCGGGANRRGAARTVSPACRLRLSLRADGALAAIPAISGCEKPDCSCRELAEHLLAKVHVQDRPGFLKGISDAVHQDCPVSIVVRLSSGDGVRAMRLQLWPGMEAGTVSALLEPVAAAEDAPAAPVDEDVKLRLLARAELLEAASSLSVLCERSMNVPGPDGANMETLRYLSRRLEETAQLLAALDEPAVPDAGVECKSLLSLLQDAANACWRHTAGRRIMVDVDVAGGVRQPVPERFAPLLRLLVASAVEMATDSTRVAVVTRREGRTAAISVTFRAADNGTGGRERAAFDLAVLSNLAIRHGGRLAIIHRQASARQWVLRLPLATGAAEGGAGRADRRCAGVPPEWPEGSYFSKRGTNLA